MRQRTVGTGLGGIGSRAVRYAQAARIALRARLHVRGYVPGLLSVVVPAFNVERYIDDCLRSLRRQAYRDIEVIVVDDGSPDGSARIAEHHRRRDPRVRIVRRRNGGPSAARNTGIEAARGEFMTFVDPDDIVATDGYRQAIAALDESGSDFAVLYYDRLKFGRRQKPGPWISAAHARRRLRCTLDEVPGIQVNAVVWSKVFRRGFVDAAGLRFPEGAIYEDQPVSARAYAKARTFDILPDLVVTWRVREDGTSITQQTSSVDNLGAHNEAVRASLAELDEAGRTAAATSRALQLLANNMRLFTQHVHTADDEFWRVIQTGLRELVERSPSAEYVTEVPAQDKVLNELILRDDRARAAEFLAAGGLDLTRFATQRSDRGYLVRLPFYDDRDAAIPADCFVLADTQLSVNSTVTGLRWDDPGTLQIAGWAYIRNVDLAHSPPAIAIRAMDEDGNRVSLTTTRRHCADPEEVGAHRYCDYRNGCFTASLEIAHLEGGPGPWRFEVEIAVPGVTRSAPLAITSSMGSAAASQVSPYSDRGVAYAAGRFARGDFGLHQVRHETQRTTNRRQGAE